MERLDSTNLCVHRHRLSSREIPCADCVSVIMNFDRSPLTGISIWGGRKGYTFSYVE